MRALEETILKQTRLRPSSFFQHVHHSDGSSTANEPPINKFEQRLSQADAYLQLLIQQISAMESRPELAEVVKKANEFLEAVKHSIVLLQIAKVYV